jgi:chromosome segregation ATPase
MDELKEEKTDTEQMVNAMEKEINEFKEEKTGMNQQMEEVNHEKTDTEEKLNAMQH